MRKKPRISYRDWLHRDPSAGAAPVESEPIAEALPVEYEPAPLAEPIAVIEMPIEIEADVASPPSVLVKTELEVAPDEHLLFCVGQELFALPLNTVEEAMDIDAIQRIPEMSETMLGVLTVRGAMVPLYSPAIPLGVEALARKVALIFALPRGLVALAVDDVEDVTAIPAADIQRSPLDFGDGVLIGVARRGADLIGVLDAAALVAACRAEPVLETA